MYLISGIFRKNQPFFQFYGSLHRAMLRCVSHFFVQNEESKILLQTLGIDHVTISGDTRFDRVAENALHPKSFDLIKFFCGNSKVLIAGSTWPEDEKLLIHLLQQYPDWKLIIAPHEIASNIEALAQNTQSMKYSQLSFSDLGLNTQHPILIIDNVGMLSSLYQYGHVAYIGGGFGSGIHNILEAAAFGLPVLFGPNYQKFQEAKDMIDLGAAFSVKNFSEFQSKFKKLENKDYLTACSRVAKKYVIGHTGATEKILSFLKY